MRACWMLLVVALCASLALAIPADAGRYKGKPTMQAHSCRGGKTC